MRQCAGDDEGRRETKHWVSAPNEYEILREYGTSTMYDESAACRYENYTKVDTRNDEGTRHCEIHTFYDFRREVICLFSVWIQVFYTTATQRLSRSKPPRIHALPASHCCTAVQFYLAA